MSRLVLRPDATFDIRAATLWYDDQEPGLGDRFTSQIGAAFGRIAELPTRFPIIDDPIRRALLREFPYAVGFVVEPSRIVIIGVFHQHRDPTVWRERFDTP